MSSENKNERYLWKSFLDVKPLEAEKLDPNSYRDLYILGL